MFTEAKKLHLIEEVLKTDDEAILIAVETILNQTAKTAKPKPFSAHEFAGKWSKEDAALIEKAISEGCEQIREDDWK